MPTENILWHARIGIFNLNKSICKKRTEVFFNKLLHCILVIYSFNFHHLLILQSGDIEINPGSEKSSRLNFCYWNLNAIATHFFVKVPLIEAFMKANNIDICLSKAF